MNMSEEIEYKPQITFETIKKTNTHGQDCWSARELGKILGYAEFRNFLPVIDKAKEACQNSGYAISDHFVDSHEMVDIGSGARTSALYKKNSVAWICDPGS
jgi:DNA-damage-inducible protein D